MGAFRKWFKLDESSTHIGLGVIGLGIDAYLKGGSQAAVATVLAGVFSVLYPQNQTPK
jgi:hypothetical protein